MTMTRLAKSTLVLISIMMACSSAWAQDGLAGELDDLLGLGGGDDVAAPAAAPAAEAPAAKAEEAAPAAEAVAEKAEEVVAEAAPAAEAAAEKAEEAVAEAAPAAEAVAEKAEEAVAEAAPAAEAAAEKAEEAVAEAAPAAEAVAEKAEEAVAEAAPAAEAAAEKAEEAVAEAAPAAEAAAEKAEEAVAEAAPAAEKAEDVEDKLGELLAGDDKPAEAPAVEKADADKKVDDGLLAPIEDEVAEVVEEKKDVVPAAEEVATVVEETPAAEPAAEPTAVADNAQTVPAAGAAVAAGEGGQAADSALADDDLALIDEIATLERVRKQALEKHGKASLENARKEMKEGNYAEAQRLYEEAVKFITKRPGNETIIDEAEEGIAESIYRQAVVLWKKEVMEEALQMARKAREKNHPKASQLIADIQAQIDNPPKPPRPKAVKRWKESEYKDNEEDVRIRIGKAREYYVTGEYDLARQELEVILRDNPYNQDAIVLLKRVADREYDFSSSEFETTRSSMISDVRDKWTAKNIYAINVPTQLKTGATVVTGKAITDSSGKTPEEVTADRMRDIEIPSINFRAANINDVVDFLQQASRDYDDPQLPPEKRGINMILKLATPTAAPDAGLGEPDPFSTAAAPSSTGGVPPVTFKATSMNLYEVLQAITDISGLKFRIRGNLVMIMPIDMPTEDMVSKTYTVLPNIKDRAMGVARDLSSNNKFNSANSFDTAEISSDGESDVDWKQLFSDMGVKWPTGSKISFLSGINKMRVYNTPENIVEFEKALQELNVTPRQIEIEARFVEVGQRDLDSLGIEWGISDPWEVAKNRKDPQQYISVDKMGSGESLRNLTTASSSFNGMANVDDGILKIASHLTNPEISVLLRALSQKSNTDLLSAPKVVTQAGQQAIIKVVTEYIFPREYELQEYDSSGDSDNVQNVYPAVQPTDFDMREVGVILDVTPSVSEDGQLISLMLNPQIISEPEWVDYGFEYPKGTLNADGEMDTYHITMKQPLFKVRSIQSNVDIYNGATVVMGGMITEDRIEVEDKIPFLGDIPLIGRLFRSNYEQSEKRNLLIFVTARLVDPAGRTVTNESASGETSN